MPNSGKSKETIEHEASGLFLTGFQTRSLIAPDQDASKQSFLPMLHGKGTDDIATMIGQPIEENPLNNTGLISSGEMTLVLMDFDKIKGKNSLGVSTHKLLSVAVAQFTQHNHTGNTARKLTETAVNIPLREYAAMCGYDVMEKPTETEEEASKEAKRAENELKDARKKINKDLGLLYSASVSWKEKVRGQQGDYMDIRLIEAKGIRNGFIKLVFSQSFGNYLIGLPITQYPIALLGADERNINAYSIGLKLTEHFNLDNNQKRGTAQLLKVSTLLSYTSLPKIDSLSVKKNGWESRIKEPLERSLDALTACGLIEDWRYSHSKGKPLTDHEATNFLNFEAWADTLIYFQLKDAPDHTARLKARATEKEAAIAKTKRKASRKKPKE